MLTWIKDADCDAVVGIMSRVPREGAVSWQTKATQFGWPFSLSRRCGQYIICKSKYAISIIPVTPATESTKASRASL
jgi:hypothetical protein